MRSLSQIPAQSKLLIGLQDVCGDTIAESSAFTINEWPGTLTTLEYINNNAIIYYNTTGALFRDLGRQMLIIAEDGSHRALFREAMPQDGVSTEGVGPTSVWLCVWDAAGRQACATRLG